MAEEARPEQVLMQMLVAKHLVRALGVVAELAVADHLRDGPVEVETIAQVTGSEVDPLYRVMRALAAAGVFVEEAGRRFALTPVSELLRSDVPRSLRAAARWFGAGSAWQASGALDRCVQTGEPGFVAAHGEDVFAYLSAHPEAGAVFDAMMSSFTDAAAPAIAEAIALADGCTVVDVGGSRGVLLAALLRRFPRVHAICLDRPAVIERASATRTAETGRIAWVAGDFFAAVPAADAVLLKHILHDWGDDAAVAILRRCREALHVGGRVFVIEAPIGDDVVSRMRDLEMLTMTSGGRERTIAEYTELCARAGLEVVGRTRTRAGLTILEATRK